MATIGINASGGNSATATLVAPPGAAGGATVGQRNIVLDSIVLQLQCTTAVTNGLIRLRRAGTEVLLLLSALTLGASSERVLTFTFPNGGLLFPGEPASAAEVFTSATNATTSTLLVQYHYE